MTSTRDFADSVHIGLRLMVILSLFLIPESGAPLAVQPIVLNGSISNGSRVCSGQRIEVECATTGSPIQRWGSNNYVGQTTGDLEEVIYNDTEIGKVIYTGNLNVSIELLSSTSEIEGKRLVSILRMKASSAFPNITVLCYNAVLNISDSMTFTVIDDPVIVRDVDAFQVASQIPIAAGPCILVVTWSPLTLATESRDVFNLTVNSFSLMMNSTTRHAVFNMSECGNQSIEIYAENNYCGPTVSIVVMDTTPVINIAKTIEPTAMSAFKVATVSYSSMVLPMLLTVVMLSVC